MEFLNKYNLWTNYLSRNSLVSHKNVSLYSAIKNQFTVLNKEQLPTCFRMQGSHYPVFTDRSPRADRLRRDRPTPVDDVERIRSVFLRKSSFGGLFCSDNFFGRTPSTPCSHIRSNSKVKMKINYNLHIILTFLFCEKSRL